MTTDERNAVIQLAQVVTVLLARITWFPTGERDKLEAHLVEVIAVMEKSERMETRDFDQLVPP